MCSRLEAVWNASDKPIPGNTWIGLHNDNLCGDDCDIEDRRSGWEWLDSTSYDHTVFHYWRNGSKAEPSGSDKDPCARMNVRPEPDYRGWIADSCTSFPSGFTCGYVCKKGIEFIMVAFGKFIHTRHTVSYAILPVDLL